MSITDKALKVVAERPVSLQPPAVASKVAPYAVFTADVADVATSVDPRASFLADLALHRATATPLCIGLFGSAGIGKSSLLGAVVNASSALGQAAESAGLASAFVEGAKAVSVIAEPGSDPYASLLKQVHRGLAADYPALVAEAVQVIGDPRATAREADDRLSVARHRLDDERRRLDELSSRQARLLDTVLFEGAGSRLDAYARANRARIDRAFRRFGFANDTSLAYKEAVRDAAEPGLGRGLGWLTAFWAYRGQMRLLVVAVAFFVAAWLVGSLLVNQQELLEALRTTSEKAAPAAEWLGAHASWLEPVREVLNLAGLAALAMNVLRAVRFVQPVTRGATLLRADLDTRRHDLDGLVAHQAQRVETLAREVEQASGRAAEAQQRLSRMGATRAAPSAELAAAGPAVAALEFFDSISTAVAASAGNAQGSRVPARLVVALDGFERLSPRNAAELLEASHACLARPGIVTLLAADRAHLATGVAEADPALAHAILERVVQVPVQVGAGEATWPGARTLVQAILQPHDRGGAVPEIVPDAGRSAFDKPWLPKETVVLEALAPFAGSTPRALKRYVNLYRVARADPALDEASAADLAALALGLAIASSGSLPTLGPSNGGTPLDGTVQAARHAAATALGVALDLGRESRGLDAARRYAMS